MTTTTTATCFDCGEKATRSINTMSRGTMTFCRDCAEGEITKCDKCGARVWGGDTTEPLGGKYRGGTLCLECAG